MKTTLSQNIRHWLADRFGERVRFDEPMAAHTSLRVGGPAEAMVTVRTPAELRGLLQKCKSSDAPMRIIGGGTNLLVRDAGIDGVAVVLAGDFDDIHPDGENGSGTYLRAMSGTSLKRLCRHCISGGLAGLDFAVGIPGTVGGAVVMNAGTPDGCMQSVVDRVDIMMPEGETRKIERPALRFAYRRLEIPGVDPAALLPAVILSARLKVMPAAPEELQREAVLRMQRRSRHQPYDMPSAGSFFKNPPGGKSAGQLIDEAGLKGTQVGGALVSPKHANFIVNTGGATARDIEQLMAIIRREIKAKFQVSLEPEVRIIGR